MFRQDWLGHLGGEGERTSTNVAIPKPIGFDKYLYLFSRLYFCVEEGAFFSLGSLLFVLSKQMSEQPGQRHVSGPLSHSGLCCFSHCHHQSANTRRQNQRNILHMVQFEFSPSTYRKPCVSSIFGRIPISNFHSLG